MLQTARPLTKGFVFTQRIIWFGLVMGQVFFAAVIVILHPPAAPHPPVLLLTAVDAALLFSGIVARLVVPRVLLKPGLDDQAMAKRAGTAMIIQMALLEGASFAGLVFVFLSAQWWPLGVVPAISFLVQLTLFPRSSFPA
jgi:hypothetical protein